MELRKIDDKNYKLLKEWRNENREFFFNKKIIDAKTHEKWYKAYKQDLTRTCFIIYVGHTPVGTISITIDNVIGHVDNVMLGDKRYARRGIMLKAMQKLIKAYKLPYYLLDVLTDNEAAIKFYKKLGFFELDTKGKVMTMQKSL